MKTSVIELAKIFEMPLFRVFWGTRCIQYVFLSDITTVAEVENNIPVLLSTKKHTSYVISVQVWVNQKQLSVLHYINHLKTIEQFVAGVSVKNILHPL